MSAKKEAIVFSSLSDCRKTTTAISTTIEHERLPGILIRMTAECHVRSRFGRAAAFASPHTPSTTPTIVASFRAGSVQPRIIVISQAHSVNINGMAPS